MRQLSSSELHRVTVLRAGHRPFRDKRITTHVALTARAFGADEIIVDTHDDDLEKTVNRVSWEFGGSFTIRTGINIAAAFRAFSGMKIYLSMYGLPVDRVIPKIREGFRKDDLAILVGAEKMPSWAYENSDYVVSVTNQPHSEVSALSIFLDRLYGGSELRKRTIGHMAIYPSRNGKNVKLLPDRKECMELLEKYNADDYLISHAKAVASLSLKMGERCDANLKLIEAGALLHDIGKTREKGIRHALVGAQILREENIVPEVVKIVERHTGAGISRQEAESLGLPVKNYIPATKEEKIVAHADNLMSGSKKITLNQILEIYHRKGLYEAADRIRKLHLHISRIIGIDPDLIE
ncbi:MAG: tRNA (cytidine(56)-2'-O)-methyltransferase [Candidatus Thermoplasmatota archaeon]|nr:tRNA (cytidine(56)-2'-O)-methyltransferase [Candidatus Thermoplasmatota archaeon]